MRLADHLGLIASRVDTRVLNLVKDVEVCHFKEAINFPEEIQSMVTTGRGIPTYDLYRSVKSFKIRYVVQEDHDSFVYNLIMSAMINRFPDAFLKNPLPMIMRAKDGGTTTHSIPFNCAEDKPNVMEKVRNFLSADNRVSAQSEGALLVANELMMNALYAAPVDSEGKPLFSHLPRDAKVQFPGEDYGAIMLSYNNDLLVVGCIDPFGSVDIPRTTKRLSEVFKYEGLTKIEEDNSGAGIGLKMVIENSSGFGMVMKKAEQTFAFATIPLGFGQRKVEAMSKNVFLKFY